MKQIIDGRKYDTDTAKQLGTWSNGSYGDLDFCAEELHKKRNGEFFVYGYGGPRSIYAEARGHSEWTGGERIMPMTWQQAAKWAEEHLDADEYEAIFGEVFEDGAPDGMVRVPGAVYAKLRRASERRGISIAALVGQLADMLE